MSELLTLSPHTPTRLKFNPLEDPALAKTKKSVRGIPVAFIIPPSPFLADERVFPFLGPLYVAAELRKNGNPVEVLDLSGFSNYEAIVDDFAKESVAKHFLLTATTPQFPAACRVVERLRTIVPDAIIGIGGPHATLTHTGMVQDELSGRLGRGTLAFQQLKDRFNKVIVGDGQLAIFPALDPKNKQQVIDAGDKDSSLFMQKGTLDQFEFPARDLIDMDSYHYQIDGRRAFSVIGQLGCPFECGFCGGRDSNVFRMARQRSIPNVVLEIETVVRQSMKAGNRYEGAMFYDDELNVSPNNLEALCKGLIDMQERLGFGMRFRGFVKAQLFTLEQAKLMYAAGFRILLSGVESGSEDMLNTMKKRTTPLINKICMDYAHKARLQFKALMSIGHPGESRKTIDESVEWVLQNRPDDVDWTIITQYPGSPYYDRSIYDEDKKAWVYIEPKSKNRLWSASVDFATQAEYYKGVPGDYTAYVWTDTLTPEQLVEARDAAEMTTRSALGLAPIESIAALQFEHSMGQNLPRNILRRSYS